MTFEQAIQAAADIRQHYHRLDVLAIGRFLTPDELDKKPEDWGISISVDNGQQVKRIFSAHSLVQYANYEGDKKPKKPRAKPTIEETDSALLF